MKVQKNDHVFLRVFGPKSKKWVFFSLLGQNVVLKNVFGEIRCRFWTPLQKKKNWPGRFTGKRGGSNPEHLKKREKRPFRSKFCRGNFFFACHILEEILGQIFDLIKKWVQENAAQKLDFFHFFEKPKIPRACRPTFFFYFLQKNWKNASACRPVGFFDLGRNYVPN
jgi:hypothetical protein